MAKRDGREARPTRKGIALGAEQVADLKKAVSALEKALKADNLLIEEHID